MSTKSCQEEDAPDEHQELQEESESSHSPPDNNGNGRDEQDSDDESATVGSNSLTIGSQSLTIGSNSLTLEPYHIFPLHRMLPTMFPYHATAGGSICALSNNTVASDNGNIINGTKHSVASRSTKGGHSTTSNSMAGIDGTRSDDAQRVATLAKGPSESPLEGISLMLQDLHTRQLLDELQAREMQKDRSQIPGTVEYNQRMDQLEQQIKSLMGQLRTVDRNTAECEEKAMIHEMIGKLAREIGNTTMAQKSLEKALCIRKCLRGEMHESVAKSLHALGDLLDEMGDYGEAMAQHAEALNIYQNILGEKHIEVGNSLYKMGCIIRNQGFTQQALDFLQESLAIRKQHLGPDAIEVGDTLEVIGCLHAKSGEYAESVEALFFLQEVLRIRRLKQEENLMQIASILKHIFNVYIKMKEHELAIRCFEDWLVTLGDFYSDMGHASESLKSYCESLTIRMSIFGGYDRCNGSVILKAADIYFQNGETESALKLYSKFVETRQEREHDDSNSLFYALLMRGHCFYNDGNLEEAKQCFYSAADVQHDFKLFGGQVCVEDVVLKLLKSVNGTKFGKLAERVKWITRTRRGSKLKTGERGQWRTWLSNRVTRSSKSLKP